jgi:hypothetical protein
MNSFVDAAMPITSALSKLCAQAREHENSRQQQLAKFVDGPSLSFPDGSSEPVLKFKYVIIRALDVETAIIVPPFAQHNWGINLTARRPISAGFAYRAADGSIKVWGESTSLKLKSRPEDATVIRETLFMNGL